MFVLERCPSTLTWYIKVFVELPLTGTVYWGLTVCSRTRLCLIKIAKFGISVSICCLIIGKYQYFSSLTKQRTWLISLSPKMMGENQWWGGEMTARRSVLSWFNSFQFVRCKEFEKDTKLRTSIDPIQCYFYLFKLHYKTGKNCCCCCCECW